MHDSPWLRRRLGVAGALFLVASAFTLSACGGNGRGVTFDGNCTTELTVLTRESDPPGSARLGMIATCDFGTVFGQLTGASEPYLSPPNASGAFSISGQMTYTDESGDRLFVSWAGSGQYNEARTAFTYTASETYGNGTGDFTGSAGNGEITGAGDLTELTGSYTTEGLIVLD